MQKKKNGEIRIIGGEFRGRKITFFESMEDVTLRPTPDRVRETLFNWLSSMIIGSNCLDAFGGSGALSFEAISRGAKKVTLIEQSTHIIQNIQQNADRFKINENKMRLDVFNQNALDYLSKISQTFDVIFLDPPFQSNWLIPCIQLIADRHLLNEEGYLYFESSEKLPEEIISEYWEIFRSKKAGNVYYGLLQPVRHIAQ